MLTEIKKNDRYGQEKIDALLAREGIRRDKNLDYSCGIFDDDYNLIATGSCYKNTIRCTGVSEDHQGEGLLNQVMTHLMTIQAERGNAHVFVYTKPESALFFSDIGFYEIVRTERVVFMENRKDGLRDWIRGLEDGALPDFEDSHQRTDKADRVNEDVLEDEIEGAETTDEVNGDSGAVGAIVMNAAPFTKGHRYLIEKAARDVAYAASRDGGATEYERRGSVAGNGTGLLHLFIVREEAGPVPFDVRQRLVMDGTRDIPNIIYHDTGNYLISSATFPAYFLRDEDDAVKAQAEVDVKVFSLIAEKLGITRRYVGDEPYSRTTQIYNSVMEKLLPAAGVECRVIPRLSIGSEKEGAECLSERNASRIEILGEGGKEGVERPVSASIVRQAIHDGDMAAVEEMLPEVTIEFLRSPEGEDVIRAIREEDDVWHY